MSTVSASAETDPIAAAMDAHLATPPPAPAPTPTPTAAAPAAPTRPLRPWEEMGKKYPLALDYKDDATAQRINEWLDMVSGQDGAAGKCLVGEALACNLDYYKTDVDVHPLIQLTAAGLAFGGVVAFAKYREHQEEKASAPANDEKAAALEKLAEARDAKDEGASA